MIEWEASLAVAPYNAKRWHTRRTPREAPQQRWDCGRLVPAEILVVRQAEAPGAQCQRCVSWRTFEAKP